MRIAVVDGQGGGVGKALVAAILARMTAGTEVVALGTNSAATGAMLKAGARSGATGENAVVYNAPRVDAIAGPVGIVVANSMMGELSPAMARAIGESPALKVLVPMERCGIAVAGGAAMSLQERIEDAVGILLRSTKEST